MDDPQPEIRIGDRERRQVDDRLQQAHADGVLSLVEYDERAALCWAARTRRDLDALTRDLPPVAPVGATVEPARPARPAPKGLAQRVGSSVLGMALLGAGLWFGGTALTADDGVSLFGSRQLQIGSTQDRVEVGTLFGNVTVRVPDDVRVRTAGTVVFGSIDCAAACQGSPGQREVVVDATGGFGNVQVLRQNEQPRREGQGRDANDSDDDDD